MADFKIKSLLIIPLRRDFCMLVLFFVGTTCLLAMKRRKSFERTTRGRVKPSLLSEGLKFLFSKCLCAVPALALLGVFPHVSAGDEPMSPFVAGRLSDKIEWNVWSGEDLGDGNDQPLLIAVSHELNSRSLSMAKESFGNAVIADIVNAQFRSFAIDKNEYPVIAESLLAYAWNLSKVEDWPVTLFTTTDLYPIGGGGYFPPTDEWGNQGFVSVSKNLAEQWVSRKEVTLSKARDSIEEFDSLYGLGSEPEIIYSGEFLDIAIENIAYQFDFEKGGFSEAPKAVAFDKIYLLDLAIAKNDSSAQTAHKMKANLLESILNGGVYDSIRGGFFSVAIDNFWVVPDFQKTAIQQVKAIDYFSRLSDYQLVLDGLGDVLLKDFKNEAGFYTDTVWLTSDGMGEQDELAYTWVYADLESVLTLEELSAFSASFSVKAEGNVLAELDSMGSFSGRNILRINSDAEVVSPSLVQSAVSKLRKWSRLNNVIRREDVVSVSTNSLIVSALLKIGGEENDSFVKEAVHLTDNLWLRLFNEQSGKLMASLNGKRTGEGEASSKGYAFLIQALLDVGEAKADQAYIEKAKKLQTILNDRFSAESGPYLIGPADKQAFPVKLYAFLEFDTPSANAISISNLNRLAKLEPDSDYGNKLNAIMQHLPEELSYLPEQYPHLLQTLEALR